MSALAPARLLTVRQAAETLAVKEGTIYSWIAQRRLPVVRLGRAVRVPADALAALVAENTVPARSEGGAR